MSPQTEPKQSRARQAEKITRQPHLYQICEGCGSIVGISCITCPSCHAYRFDVSQDRVIKQAKKLGSRAANAVLSSDLH
jgi:Zn finger protein HypA/HybF involved in hydrogenase expression